MKGCTDLYLLSTIACELSKCLTEDELTMLGVNLTALGDMLTVLATRREICEKMKQDEQTERAGKIPPFIF